MNRFCIIIPTHDRPELLAEALRSLQAQTYEAWRAIIVNDASTKNYARVEAEFAGDARVRFVRREVNGGANEACNTGLNLAAEQDDIDFIAIMDDDDLFAEDYLETADAVIREHPGYGWFMSNNMGEQKDSSRAIVEEGELDYVDDYIYGKLRGDKGRLISARILKDLRFDGRFPGTHRWPFFTDVAQKTKIWAFPHASIRKRYLEGGITRKDKRPGDMADVLHRAYKHWHVIRRRPTQWKAYRYFVLEAIKTPGRVLRLGWHRLLRRRGD